MKALALRTVRSSFLRHFALLASGNIVAQIIPLTMLPFLTRIYDANSFGIQALLLIGIGFLVPLSSGFYEYAIPTPKSTRHARRIATLAFGLVVILNLTLLAVICLLRDTIATLLGIDEIGAWVYAYPLLASSVCMFNISNYWMLRQGKFHLQSLNKIVQATSVAVLAMLMGLAQVKDGLLIGFVSGITLAGVFSMVQAYRQGLRLDFHAPRIYYLHLLKKYSEFPIFGSIPSSVNNLAAQVPIIIITAHYALDKTGHYSVVRNLINASMFLLAASFGQVVLKYFTTRIHDHQALWPLFVRMSAVLLVIGVVGSIGTYLLGPWFFGLYLGKDWQDSVDLVQILSVCMVFWLMGPAMAHAAIAIKRLRAIALWQVMHGVLAFGLIWFGDLPFHDFVWRVVGYEVFSYSMYFLIMAITIWRYDARHKPSSF